MLDIISMSIPYVPLAQACLDAYVLNGLCCYVLACSLARLLSRTPLIVCCPAVARLLFCLLAYCKCIIYGGICKGFCLHFSKKSLFYRGEKVLYFLQQGLRLERISTSTRTLRRERVKGGHANAKSKAFIFSGLEHL